MEKRPDIIAAIATAPGRGGIGIVRVSGRNLQTFVSELLGQCPPARHAAYLDFKDSDGSPIDCGIAIFFTAPHSYTGEDVLELQGHGGTAVMHRLLQRCLDLGARMAEPGEFTRRAWLNDKLDIAQAEAVADLIQASTAEAAQSAIRSLNGEFSSHIYSLKDKLVDLRMYVEACLDFPEEDIDFISDGGVADKLTKASQELGMVFAGARQGNLLREGIHVVLIGQPNVGKSSLMNQLAGEEVAIVTPVAGTTRDTVRSVIQINGVPLHIIDTAGLRETNDEVEQQGIARTWKVTKSAQIALILVDANHGVGKVEESILNRLVTIEHQVWIHNKIDLTGTSAKVEFHDGTTHLFLSAKTGMGLQLLREHLLKLAGWQSGGEGVFMARERHLRALTKVEDSLQRAMYYLGQPELLAEELRVGQDALNEITGEFSSDDLLGEIFSRFCIGK